jgi:hypothetical protein
MIGLAAMTHAASAGPHKGGCAARDIQMLGVVAHWRAARLQDAFRRLALSAGPPLSVLSDTDAGIPVNPDRAGGGFSFPLAFAAAPAAWQCSPRSFVPPVWRAAAQQRPINSWRRRTTRRATSLRLGSFASQVSFFRNLIC